MSIAQAFADVALGVAQAFGAGFHDALAKWPGTPTMDDGGSIATPGTPISLTCSVQVDAATEAMRADEGFQQTDMRLLVLAATLDGTLDTAATIQVLAGPHQGEWSVASVERDPVGVYFECRGRRLSVEAGS